MITFAWTRNTVIKAWIHYSGIPSINPAFATIYIFLFTTFLSTLFSEIEKCIWTLLTSQSLLLKNFKNLEANIPDPFLFRGSLLLFRRYRALRLPCSISKMFFDKQSSLRPSLFTPLMLNLSQRGSKAEMIKSQPVCLHAVATFTMSSAILFDSLSNLKSFFPMFKITISGFSSIVGLT